MRIVVVGLFMKDSFGAHISETLSNMGHNVFNFAAAPNTYIYKNRIDYLVKKVFRKAHQLLVNIRIYRSLYFAQLFVHSRNADMLIVTHDFLKPDEINSLRNVNVDLKIALWFPDAVSMIGSQYFLVAGYDHLFFKDRYLVEKINNFTNLKAHYLPECFNPSNALLTSNLRQDIDISVIGNFHAWRVASLEKLCEENLEFHGVNAPAWLKNSWMNKIKTSAPVYNLQKSNVILRSKININNLHLAEVQSANARLFEINGSGGFQICSYSEIIKELYVEGEEIIMYKNSDELLAKVKHFLSSPAERGRIALNAQKRTISEHTYKHRLTELLKIVYNG